MKIIDVYIDHHEKEGLDSELIIVLDDDLPGDSDEGWTWDEVLDEQSNTHIYYGQRSDGLIRTYWGQHFPLDEPYKTTIDVYEEVTIINPAASSCPVLNWYGIGPCINATFVNRKKEPLPLNFYTNITITKCIELLNNYVPNVRLSRKNEGELEEIPYIIEDLNAAVADDEKIIYPEKLEQ